MSTDVKVRKKDKKKHKHRKHQDWDGEFAEREAVDGAAANGTADLLDHVSDDETIVEETEEKKKRSSPRRTMRRCSPICRSSW